MANNISNSCVDGCWLVIAVLGAARNDDLAKKDQNLESTAKRDLVGVGTIPWHTIVEVFAFLVHIFEDTKQS